MTEKEIKEAAVIYAEEANSIVYGDIPTEDNTKLIGSCFTDGAKWALNHQWIEAKKTLPEIVNESNYDIRHSEIVLCHMKSSDEYLLMCLYIDRTDYYWRDTHDFIHDFEVEDVDYWMPIPPKLKIK